MENNSELFTGLTEEQVLRSRSEYGSNRFGEDKGRDFFQLLKDVVTEPMFLLLIAACTVYFMVGQIAEGFMMLVAMTLVASISFFQEQRSYTALSAIKKLSQPRAKVIRSGTRQEILSEELVSGDLLLVEEGEQIPADGVLLHSSDFSVDESVLTGESVAVPKSAAVENNVFLGSTVSTGQATVRVTAVGKATMLGKLGKAIEEIKPEASGLQKEIRTFLGRMAVAGIIAFLIVFSINYFQSGIFLLSLLAALTLAMSILPEEIPVAFSTFMALGAWRLLRENVLAKDPQVIETLGSATVICIDKTGTITENKMRLAGIYALESNILGLPENGSQAGQAVLAAAMWASEPIPFDPMEVAIHEAYEKFGGADRRPGFKLVHEYPLSDSPPVMTHIYENKASERIIACKGGAESVIRYCKLTETETALVLNNLHALAAKGYRVLGVATAVFTGHTYPSDQKDFLWKFEGLIGLFDPPKTNIKTVLSKFYEAGIHVKIISGDYPETTCAIAREIGFIGTQEAVTGSDVMAMTAVELQKTANQKNLFARMFPEAKLRVINALKANGEVVAMTGDGVNDGPALKAAHIGISMGSKGTEIAKRASSIVLLNNDLANMVYAILAGRKIYGNLKKAIRYIISIHVVIILAVMAPLLLGWEYINLFSPVHITFFELIMGPTCSIIYENEPPETDLARSKPRQASAGFLKTAELGISLLQGLVISAGVLALHYFAMNKGFSESYTRTLIFTTIVLANIFLTLENRSFRYGIFKTARYKNPLVPLITGITLFLLLLIFSIPAARNLFRLEMLSAVHYLACLGVAFLSVTWIELTKWLKRKAETVPELKENPVAV